jgi:hypothetical protein
MFVERLTSDKAQAQGIHGAQLSCSSSWRASDERGTHRGQRELNRQVEENFFKAVEQIANNPKADPDVGKFFQQFCLANHTVSATWFYLHRAGE